MDSFAERLIGWYTVNKRDLPWRLTQDPYAVWLSEIILQQTRVDQGLPYWERFMKKFPTVEALADASEENILRLWQGLGYYSRARNLHAAAKYIKNELKGVFPRTFREILQLKGVGPYTAAAIASICFGEATPVVDGNVFRFASRYFGITENIASSKTRKTFENLLRDHILKENPGNFNQAMMEFGARVCTPSPNCSFCTFQMGCYAFKRNLQKKLPNKSKKINVRDRFFHYLVLKSENRYYMKVRQSNDVWTGLYDFYLIEGEMNEDEVLHESSKFLDDIDFTVEQVSDKVKHILSHQRIHARFYELELNENDQTSVLQKAGLHAFSHDEMLNLPKPKLIVNYLDQLGIK
ncbi:MAG: A/G-specific adenine glycosylase [Bacteroidota bacterium]